MKSFSTLSFTSLFRHHSLAWWVMAVVVIALASWLRLYNLAGTLQFLGDQGRDAIIVADIWRRQDLVFIGPVTSVGNMYLGPLYYYFMVPFLWLSYPSPLGPAYAVAGLGILTVIAMYWLGRELIGERAAQIGAFFLAFSAVVIQYTRFSWNPNPAPLVSLVMIWATYRAWQKNPWYWLVVGICFSVLIQLHYLTLLSAGSAGLVWLYSFLNHWSATWPSQGWWVSLQRYFHTKISPATRAAAQRQLRHQLLATLGAALIFGLSLTPLILFDWKHQGLNAKALIGIFTEEESFKVVSTQPAWLKAAETVWEVHGRALHILFEYSLGKFRLANTSLVMLVAVTAWRLWRQRATRPTQTGEAVVWCYLVVGILGTALYEHTIFDHYIAYLFPVTFLVYGLVADYWWPHHWGKVGLAIFGVTFLALNWPRYPWQSAGWTIADINQVSQDVQNHLRPNERFGLVLLSETKDLYGQNYRYFLTTMPNQPLPPERVNEADTLVIINEQGVKDPINTSIHEIATFPSHTADEVYTTHGGIEIVVLRRPTSPPPANSALPVP